MSAENSDNNKTREENMPSFNINELEIKREQRRSNVRIICYLCVNWNVFDSGFNRNRLAYVGGALRGGNRSAWGCCWLGGFNHRILVWC